MKHRWILTLLSVALLFGVIHAEDNSAEQKVPTDQTAQIPKGSAMVARLPSLDRLDEIAKRFKGIAEMIEGPQAKVILEAGASNFLLAQANLDPAGFDRSTPVVLSMPDDDDDPYLLLVPAKEKGISGEKELEGGMKLVVKDGLVHIGKANDIAAERRGKPARLLEGDFAMHFFIGELTERHKQDLEQGFDQMKQMAGMGLQQAGMPVEVALDPLMSAIRGMVYGVDTIDYAVTVRDDVLDTEGLIRTKAESGLRKFLARAGAPRDIALADYLPSEAFMTVDMAVTPDWPGMELMDLVKNTAGAELGEAVGVMLSMSKPIWGALSGRSAVSMTMQGMMGFNMHGIYELKEGTDTAKLFDKFDISKINEGMKKMQVPLEYKLEKNVAQHGETQLHKLSMTSEDPDMAMALMYSTYYMAAEGNHMYMVMSMNGELEIKDLIDRVRKGEPKPSAHGKAVDRLARKRNFGLTINFGALKPILMMVAMADPSGQANQFLNAMPDELLMSTAVSLQEGDIHWRGDFPLAKVIKMVEDIKAAQGGQGGPGGDTEFD